MGCYSNCAFATSQGLVGIPHAITQAGRPAGVHGFLSGVGKSAAGSRMR
jgi:hypothetical protein